MAGRLASAPAVHGQTPEAVIETALPLFTEQAAAFDAWVAEGEADVAAGRVAPVEAVVAALDAEIARARLRRS